MPQEQPLGLPSGSGGRFTLDLTLIRRSVSFRQEDRQTDWPADQLLFRRPT